MRHLRHSRDVSDVRPTFATFGFHRITSHIVQTHPESFLSCLFASLVHRLAFPFTLPKAFALMDLHQENMILLFLALITNRVLYANIASISLRAFKNKCP